MGMKMMDVLVAYRGLVVVMMVVRGMNAIFMSPANNSTATAARSLKCQQLRLNNLPVVIGSMPVLNKTELVEAIQEYGEEPPSSWTTVELKNRLTELGGSVNKKTGKGKSELQSWTIQLNKASRKKSQLQEFCREELKLTITNNETIAQMEQMAMEKIYYLAKCDSQDGVGFGLHSSMTYEQLQIEQPRYCEWVMTTAKEGGCCYRLARLARWLEEQKDLPKQVVKPSPKAKNPPKKPGKSVGKSSEAGSQSSNEQVMAMMQNTQAMLNQVMTVVGALKEDVDVLKEDKPHKNAKSEHDFSMISEKSSP